MYEELKKYIAQYIKTNRREEITGQIMQNVLFEVVNYIGTDVENSVAYEAQRATSAEVKLDTRISELLDKLNIAIADKEKVLADLRLMVLEEIERAKETELTIGDNITKETQERKSTDEELRTAIADALAEAKDYTNTVASGAMKWKGVVATMQDLPRDARVGDFYTVTAEHNKEFAWDGSKWYDIGSDMDMDEMRADVDANKEAVEAERLRATTAEAELTASVATKADATSVTELSNALRSEVSARETAVGDAVRELKEADEAIRGMVKTTGADLITERQERKAADAELKELIGTTSASVTDLLAQVRQEVADRQAAISALDEALKQEVERATGEEQRLDRSKPEKEWITDFMINNNLTED